MALEAEFLRVRFKFRLKLIALLRVHRLTPRLAQWLALPLTLPRALQTISVTWH